MLKSFRLLASVAFAVSALSMAGSAARADQIAAISPGDVALPAAVAAPAAHPAIFNSREIHSANVAQFTNWTGMLTRWERDRQAAACAGGTSDTDSNCVPAEWRDLVRELKGLPLRTMLQRVNTALNRHPYITSVENWGVANHWETPYEFLRRSGQCQDYAIAKFMLLRALGVANDDLRIVVLRDVDRQLDHAVVVAYAGGEALMLDSLSEAVVPVAQAASYRPYYSINETGWWLHLSGAAQPHATPHYISATQRRAPVTRNQTLEASKPVGTSPSFQTGAAKPDDLRLSMIEVFSVN